MDVAVNQDNSAKYSGRYLKILSVQEIGNLGVDMVDPETSGLARRKIIEAQFFPTGIIRVAG